jgi:hypothetical protein
MLNNNKVSHFCCDLFYKNGLQTNCFDTHNDSYLKLNQLKWYSFLILILFLF